MVFSSGADSVSVGVLAGGVFFVVILSLCAWMAGRLQQTRYLPGQDLMDYAENALPARKRREACREFPVVSESIIRGLLHIGRGRPPQ